MKNAKLKALVLGVGIALGTATPRAEAVVFHDFIHTLQNIFTQLYGIGSDVQEYTEEYRRWQQQMREFQRYIAKLQGYMSMFNMPHNQDMEKVDRMWSVEDKCGAASMLNPRELLGRFTLNPEGNVLQQQRDICARIQIAKNDRYNYTVDFMETIKPALERELRELQVRRNVSNEPGDLAAAASDNTALANNVELQFQAWDAQMKGYDAYIASMEDSNRTLAQRALGGRKPNLVREVVKTVALKEALGQ